MENTPDVQFRNLKNTAGDETEARLLFDAVTLGERQVQALETLALQNKTKMEDEALREQEERLDERKEQELLESIKTAIEEKNTDEAIKTIVALGKSLRDAQEANTSAIVSAIDGKDNRDVVDAVAGLGSAIIPLLGKEEPPIDLSSIDFSPVIEASAKNETATREGSEKVAKGLDTLAGGLVKIAEATKANAPKEEVSVVKPSWWKPFTWDSSWLDPIRTLLEKIADKEELPTKNGRVLVDIGQTFPRVISGGGGGTPDVRIFDKEGKGVNPATEETLQEVRDAFVEYDETVIDTSNLNNIVASYYKDSVLIKTENIQTNGGIITITKS